MKYYTIAKNNGVFDQYMMENNGHFALISFIDDDLSDIYNKIKHDCVAEQTFEESMLQVVFFEFVSEDNYLYRMSYATGQVKKEFKWPLKKLFKQYHNTEKIANQVEIRNKNITENYKEDTIECQKKTLSIYKKYKFIDRENITSISFRLKKSSKKGKMPLVIYFHGAGCLGEDNIKQYCEYKSMGMFLSKRDCHVLLPQCTNEIGDNIAIIVKYCKSINKLVKKLSEMVQIDYDRIYIVGTSYGGGCAWYSLYEIPNFYAAAIPLMGYFPSYNSTYFDMKAFENENIWIGHAENDKMVSIKDDETMFEMLKNAGYNVKMTKYKKFGHSMCGVFLRKEKWKKWLFEQKRN